MFEQCKKIITELISRCQNGQETFHVITVFDDPYNIKAASGMIFPIEIADVESGFICASTYYTGYKDFMSLKTDIEKNIFCNLNKKYLVYSTSQLGVDVDRRAYVPIFCKQLGMDLLTCNAYQLGLLMDKSHYFSLLKSFLHIPKTITFLGNEMPQNIITTPYVILKPALECAAVGEVKVENRNNIIGKLVSDMYKKFNQKIIIQEYIDGYEVSVPVIEKSGKYIATPPVWVKFNGDILDYNKVDNCEYSFAVLPCQDFPYNEVIPLICKHAEQVMQFIGSRGLTRVDYRIKNVQEFYIFDIAALPVLANTGTCAQSFKALFGNVESMFEAIIGSRLI